MTFEGFTEPATGVSPEGVCSPETLTVHGRRLERLTIILVARLVGQPGNAAKGVSLCSGYTALFLTCRCGNRW